MDWFETWFDTPYYHILSLVSDKNNFKVGFPY